jgi:Tle cognate immunity protein 4 C-terminal domain/Tle cognate immunity protein 4 N-terminal domain
MNQDTSLRKTHCLGRYLIDLPQDAVIESSFKYANGYVETRRNVSKSAFDQIVDKREKELRASKHDKFGNLFVAQTELSKNKVLIQSWAGAASSRTHVNEAFIYLEDRRVLYLQKDESSASAQADSVRLAKRIAEQYQYRENDSIPTAPGFCINYGLLASNVLNREEFGAAIRLKRYPSVDIDLGSRITGTPDGEGLLSRADREITAMGQAMAGVKALRKGSRNIDNVKGEELLLTAQKDGVKVYEFNWQSRGAVNSLEFPSMSFRLTTGQQTKDGSLINAPFKTDDEALQLWDSILQSLRLRPGSV